MVDNGAGSGDGSWDTWVENLHTVGLLSMFSHLFFSHLSLWYFLHHNHWNSGGVDVSFRFGIFFYAELRTKLVSNLWLNSG